MNKPFTIQINSLEALERLIGGSTQMEIDIRNAVVQKFTEKHLKPLAEHPDIKLMVASIGTAAKLSVEKLVTEQIGEVKLTYGGSVDSVKLNRAVVTEIESHVRGAAARLVDQAVEDTLATLREGLAARISGAVKHRLDYEIANEVKKQVGEAFQRALQGGGK